MKRAYKYRFYSTGQQQQELLRTFGCVRLVYNKALQARTEAWYSEQRRVNYVETSALLTEWKKTDELAFSSEVSSVPLQQCLDSLPLGVREWTCPGCGAVHDRDVNAARTILAAGLAVAACGGGVRPTRQQSVRRSPVKQETQPARVGIPRF